MAGFPARPVICIETGVAYRSVHFAERFQGGHININRVLNGQREMAGGYHWRYLTVDDIKRSKPVQCVETGEIFVSIIAAARFFEVDKENIIDCLAGTQKTTKGLHWKEYHFDERWVVYDDSSYEDINIHRKKNLENRAFWAQKNKEKEELRKQKEAEKKKKEREKLKKRKKKKKTKKKERKDGNSRV